MFRCKGLISYLSIFLYNSSFVGKSPVKDINIPSNSKKMKQHNNIEKKEIIKMSNSFQSIGAFFLRVFRISNNLPISDSLFFFTTVNFYPWDHCFYMAWAIRLVIRNQND